MKMKVSVYIVFWHLFMSSTLLSAADSHVSERDYLEDYELLNDDGVCRHYTDEEKTEIENCEDEYAVIIKHQYCTLESCFNACEEKYGEKCAGIEWDEICNCEMYHEIENPPQTSRVYDGELNVCFAKRKKETRKVDECRYSFKGFGVCAGNRSNAESLNHIPNYKQCRRYCSNTKDCAGFEWNRIIRRCLIFTQDALSSSIVPGGDEDFCLVKIANKVCEHDSSPGNTACDSSSTACDLSFSNLKNVNASYILTLTSVRDLFLNNNGLASIPSQIGALTSLTLLNVAFNDLTLLPSQIGKLTNLRRLDANSNTLQSIPSELGYLRNLTYLDLGRNQMKSVPSNIGSMKQMKRLDLRHNTITHIPKQIGNLTETYELYLANNSLQYVPKQLGKLVKLGVFELNRNKLTDVPTQIFQLGGLKQLDLSHNLFQTIPSQLGNLKNLTELEMANNELSFLPSEIGNLGKLKDLDIVHNQISQLPSEIGNMTELTSLHVAENRLGRFPPELKYLDKLSILKASFNNISNINFHGSWSNLKELDLFNNSIEMFQVDASFETTRSLLEKLELSYNNIVNLPTNFFSVITSVQHLSLAGNKLNELSSEIGRMTSLIKLNVKNNKLLALPREIQTLNLSTIELDGNSEIVCDCRLLSWFLPFVSSFNERKINGNINSLICSAVNEYDGTNPQLISVDEEAPCSHVLLTNTVSTNSTVTAEWEYPLLSMDIKNSSLKGNYYNDYLKGAYLYTKYEESMDEFQSRYGFDFPTELVIESYFNVSSDLSIHEHIRSDAAQQNPVAQEAFSECRGFPSPYPGGFAFGFEISWESAGWKRRRCVWASEVSINKTAFSFTVKSLKPATSYSMYIRPFKVYFGISPFIVSPDTREDVKPPGFILNPARYVFGPKSRVITPKTEDYKPLAAPGGIVFTRVEANSFLAEWEKLAKDLAQGEVVGYQVQVKNKNSGAILKKDTKKERITINSLVPGTRYSFFLRAWTRSMSNPEIKQWGPWSTEPIDIKTCPDHMKRSGLNNTECVAVVGYSRDASHDQVSSCSQTNLSLVLEQGSCLQQNTTVDTLQIRPHFWRNSLLTYDIRRCPNPNYCKKTSSMLISTDQQCSEYHTGVYCYECVNNFSLTSKGCIECSEEQQSLHYTRMVWLFAFILLLFLLGIVNTFVNIPTSLSKNCAKSKRMYRKENGNNIPKEGNDTGKQSPRVERDADTKSKFFRSLQRLFHSLVSAFQVKIRIVFGFFQVFLSFQHAFHRGINKPDTSFFEMVTTLNPDSFWELFDVQCAYEYSHYDILFVYTTIPILFVVLTFIIYKLFAKLYKDQKEYMAHQTIRMIFYLTFIVYPGVSQVILETYICEEFPYSTEKQETMHSYLRSDYRISCHSSSERIFVLIYASMMIVIYPIGIVLLYAWFLNRYHQSIIKRGSSTLSKSDNKRLKRVEFLVLPYQVKYNWFETYELVRKLTQTGLAVALLRISDQMPYLSQIVATNVSVAAMLVLVSTKPYVKKGDYYFALVSLLLLAITPQLSLLGLSEKDISNGFSVILSLEILLMVLIACAESAYSALRKNRDENKVTEDNDKGCFALSQIESEYIRDENKVPEDNDKGRFALSQIESEYISVVNESLDLMNENRIITFQNENLIKENSDLKRKIDAKDYIVDDGAGVILS